MAGSLQPGILPRPHELTALKNQKTQRSDRLPTRRPERFFIRPPKQTAQPRSKRTSPPLEGVQGSDAPRPRATATHLRFCKQATSSSSKANQHALPSIETSNRAAKESRCLLRGCRGATLPALEQRSRTSNLKTSNIQLVISKLTRFTLNRNSQPRSKRTSPPLEGVRGSDAPRPRATVAHLRFRKQAAPRSSQTLHRNTALYLQENAQPRSKKTSPPLRRGRGATPAALAGRARTFNNK